MIAALRNLRVSELQVNVYNSEAEIARAAAEIVYEYLYNVLQERESVSVLLATGNSQLKFLDELISLGGIDWSRVTCFHLDEYLGISADHPASFRRYLKEKVEQKVNPQVFHYIEGDAQQPLIECARYSGLLQSHKIDLCLLGIGENGHLAFNDPFVADFDDRYTVKLVKLDEVNRQQQVNTGYFSNIEQVPQYAFTVTLPTICAARKIICLAPSQRKAKIIAKMLQGEVTTTCPASILLHQPQATLFLDVDSASLI
ncbi:glucosamine-6-P isomerase [Calothrix sp. NIES-4071]|nr:glucosamine-6-P isomerase [Calothrix sp. NIES-4071]BAZ55443.1 glucosamine-6-P isomerase [Calothrix sp. NIES-4105]